jgi:hypothetical protein
MKIFRSRTAIMLASAAAFSMTASPVFAQNWGGGWGRRDRHDDTGWIVGGIIGIGMIAAIASAASKSKRDNEARYPGRDYPNRDYRSDDYRNDGYRSGGYANDRDYRGDNAYRSNSYRSSSRGIDGAVDTCVNEVERGSSRVDTVDSVDRDGEGWRITGRISGGRNFDCSTDRDGRIRNATVDGRAAW